MASTNLFPISDVYNSGWTAASGTTLWNMINGADQTDGTYIQVANTGIPFKVQLRDVPSYGPGASTVQANIVARTTTGSAFINGSAYDGDGKYIGDITKNVNSTTYSAYVINMSSNVGKNLKGITLEIQNSANSFVSSQLSTLRISDMSVTVSSSPFYEEKTLQENLNTLYGYGLHEYTPTEALVKYLGLDDYYKGQYTFDQLYNILHFDDIKKDASAWDPVAYNANVRHAIDLATFGPLDGKRFTRSEVAGKQIQVNESGPTEFVLNAFPTVERYSFNQRGNGLNSNNGNALYTNASLASAYKDSGTSLFVGYSAGIFATGTAPSFLPGAIGQIGVQFDIKPFVHSSGYTGGTTLFELPNYMRVDYSGSGFDQFVVNLHDGSSYVSALQSNGVTFKANENVHFEIFCLLPELTIIYMVNGTANAFYSDAGFDGGTYPSTFYLGTNASKTSPFSGAISELRFTTDVKLLD